jgi:outer membrane assembly lipoprotein YfiO
MLDMYGSSDLFVPALGGQMDIACRFLNGAKRIVWGFIPAGATTEGITILEKIEQRWPGSELAAAALMRKGAYYFDCRKFLESQHAYQTVVENYQKNSCYERAMLYSARATHAQYIGSSYDTNCLAEALIRYEQYCQSFPEEAEKYKIRQQMELIKTQQAGKEFAIADFYWRTGKKQAAREYWAGICRQYPETDWAVQARKLLEKHYVNG